MSPQSKAADGGRKVERWGKSQAQSSKFQGNTKLQVPSQTAVPYWSFEFLWCFELGI
jgi:hypothetical protein